MIDLYTWTTPNGRKISIMLEEIGLPYKVMPVNLTKEEQLTPQFTAIVVVFGAVRGWGQELGGAGGHRQHRDA